ncbi:endonuclease/exonuclease/phosphatase family protein [Sphingobacterium sp.]|jgi:endonuclease/exonuclease/phosphatase family metal-dependent hydrolase|uniref:endonuclease/exonuclease/phosphatase family protein n=1 Tax=Sphingobacterium sp. TaxID=341027 RepID=UPI00289AAF84|nr:endonuclease/exonuclease/phosphatase family protein [Sphingobacterium sp.]
MAQEFEFRPIRISQLLIKIVVILVALMTSLSFLALFIPPQTTVVFQWIGVLLPALVCSNLLFFIIGLYKRSWYSICPLIALLANFHYFTKIIQANPIGNVETANIRFASYNVREFKMIYNLSSMQQIASYIDSQQVNTLCLQEVPAHCSIAELKSVFTKFHYFMLTENKEGQHQLAILSKFPLNAVETISFDERPNCAIFADLSLKKNKIRIGNCHLQTTNWNQVKGDLLPAENAGYKWWSAIKTMSANFRLRGAQADRLREAMDSSPFPMLMCGDFNNSPNSYSYHKIKGNMKDAFCESGNGYGYTYTNLMKLFRIDFVFFSGPEFQAMNYRTGDVDYSDHLPVLVDFKIN